MNFFFEQLYEMTKRMERYGHKIEWSEPEPGARVQHWKAQIRLGEWTYHLSARPHDSERKSYLGCIASKDNGGGHDMADGQFLFSTWGRIMEDIVAHRIHIEGAK